MGNGDIILKSNDIDKMTFYLEYVNILIDFFEKRNMVVDELYQEKDALERKINALLSTKD